MTYFSVVQIDMHPAPYVAATGSARSAVARQPSCP